MCVTDVFQGYVLALVELIYSCLLQTGSCVLAVGVLLKDCYHFYCERVLLICLACTAIHF